MDSKQQRGTKGDGWRGEATEETVEQNDQSGCEIEIHPVVGSTRLEIGGLLVFFPPFIRIGILGHLPAEPFEAVVPGKRLLEFAIVDGDSEDIIAHPGAGLNRPVGEPNGADESRNRQEGLQPVEHGLVI